MSTQKERFEGYAQSRFEVQIGEETLRIRVGATNRALDDALKGLGVGEWALLSAHNPGGEAREAAENEESQRTLCAVVDDMGFEAHSATATCPRGGVPAEVCLLILDIWKSQALELGRGFGQEAILYGRVGESAQLLACVVPPSDEVEVIRVGRDSAAESGPESESKSESAEG
ncbi:MAG: DUF3293 domain-containing protein [Proteobacteria bacterium]|nr:DUF3293 domain-containing protein [Pseudomonadota bacterium]